MIACLLVLIISLKLWTHHSRSHALSVSPRRAPLQQPHGLELDHMVALVHHPIKEGWKFPHTVRGRLLSTSYLRYAVLREGKEIRGSFVDYALAGTSWDPLRYILPLRGEL